MKIQKTLFYATAWMVAFGLLAAPLRAEENNSPNFCLPGLAATVNGVQIPTSLVWQKLLGASGNQVLTALVDDILIEQEANKERANLQGAKKKQKFKTIAALLAPEVEARMVQLKKQFKDDAEYAAQLKKTGMEEAALKRTLLLDLMKQKLVESQIQVSEQEAKKYFDENIERLATPPQVHLKHIVVATEQEAKDILLGLNVGANFDLLAKEKSLDAASKDRGGDLGFFGPGMLTPEIQKKVFALPVGGMDIIPMQTGFSVIQVVEKKEAKAAVWNPETKNNIKNALSQEKFNQVYPKFIQQLRENAKINISLNQ